MKHPLLTASFCLWASHFLVAGPTDTPDPHDNYNGHQSGRITLDYLMLAYDIAEVFVHENVMDLQHDDDNRKL